MPNLAFWKKDASLWAKNDPVPPPATHFDPEPSPNEGFTKDFGSSKDELIASAQEQDEEFVQKSLDSNDDYGSLKKVDGNQKGNPIRQPYQFLATEDLSSAPDENTFQPGGQIKTELPDFSSSGNSNLSSSLAFDNSAKDNVAMNNNQFGGGELAKPNSGPISNGSEWSDDFNSQEPSNRSIAGNSNQLGGINPAMPTNRTDDSFRKKISNEFPGLANQFKENDSSTARIETPNLGNRNGNFPTNEIAPPTSSFQSNGSFEPPSGFAQNVAQSEIRTPQRQTIGSSFSGNSRTGIGNGLTPVIDKSNGSPTPPNNGLRLSEDSAAPKGYPSTQYDGFAAKSNPGGLQPLRNNPSATQNRGHSPSAFPENDIILPPALRSASIQFAPGSVSRLTPNNSLSPLEIR